MDSGRGITGGGSGYAALLAHVEGALYGTELGSVTLKRIGFFCFPIKHSKSLNTHRGSGCLADGAAAAAPVTEVAADQYNLNVVDCNTSVTVARPTVLNLSQWGSGG